MLAIVLSALAAQAELLAAESDHPVFEKDIQFFEAIDAKVPPPKDPIVFLGSSAIDRWNLAKSFPGLPAVNRGLDGSRIADATYFWNRTVAKYQPRAVVLYAGDNDLAEGEMTPEAVSADFRAFVADVRAAAPQARIVFISIKPSIERWALIDSIRKTNTLIKKLCESDPLTTYVDVEGAMLGADGMPKKELFIDGLHLSATGYRLWVSLVAPHLSQPDAVLTAAQMDIDLVSGELGQKLHEHMTSLARKGFSGVLFVAKDGKVVIAKGYGLAHREANTPFTSTTVFDIGSITKQFTGAAIARLEMQGKLSADDKLSKFFPITPPDKADITLHHLLTHSAGLQGDFGGDYDAKERVFARTVKEAPFSKYWYNYGWSLHDTPRRTRVTEHIGGNGIFFADFVRYIDEGTVIIAASNCSEDAEGNYMEEIRKLVFP